MKKIAFCAAALLLFTCFLPAAAQKPSHKRCHTVEYYARLFARNPELKERFEEARAKLARSTRMRADQRMGTLRDTIPVVIHVVGDAALQAQVTDAVLQSQIDVLNEDFQGLNGDSARIPAAFKGRYGKMGITFVLAKRSATGALTNGIERRTQNITFTDATADDAKLADLGGLDAWDPRNYLNLWVVSFGNTGLLGISVFPGDSRPLNLHGFVCDYRAFGRNANYLYSEFNRGRTTTHELGHFLNLYHIWGDDNGGCMESDFDGPTAALDDTPNQGDATLGNPDPAGSGAVLKDGCNAGASGIMYQNYMDYSDDAALVLFTQGQNLRMEAALTSSPDRAPLLRSNTFTIFRRDAGIYRVLHPAQGSLNCTPDLRPKVVVKNEGSLALSSVTVAYRVNNGPLITEVLPVNLPAHGGLATVDLGTITGLPGNNTLTVITSLGTAADENSTNDTLQTSFIIPAGVQLPLRESFEGFQFPPADWSAWNPNGNFTWTTSVPGRASFQSLFIDNYNNEAYNQQDDLRTPVLLVPGADSLIISFDLAHKFYPDPLNHDSLAILVSTDCGASFFPLFRKGGAGLATAGSSQDEYLNPKAGDWSTIRLALGGDKFPGGKVLVAFRNTNRFGNNIFLDNIIIEALYPRDLQVMRIEAPDPVVCSPEVTPRVRVRNTGQDTLTSFELSYQVNEGVVQTTTISGLSLPRFSEQTIALPATAIPVGQHRLTVFTHHPVSRTGNSDQNLHNDTASISFGRSGTVQPPLTEGFENNTFPPNGWVVANPDDSLTWKRAALGNRSSGSAFLNSFHYPVPHTHDDLYTPYLTYQQPDSLLLDFDLAAATYSNPGTRSIPIDTLQVLVTTDCGATFETVYKKWGTALQTLNAPTTPQTDEFFPQGIAQWRRESIDLTSFAGQPGLQVVFRVSSNYENNIFIDNVDLRTKRLPERLKAQGFLLLPVPFRDRFSVWHLEPPTGLRTIRVFNTSGQLVWTRTFRNSSDKVIDVNLQG
ncbi:MAG TPA: choice-of-anchor J domain-containing protein, partial [Chitinophagaceae bacterium]|nr:choice-of-anchor J domain-containing protein [Chitinophagaceae bacterium]